VLNSCILFNQIDIINHVQADPTFLRDVVGTFLDEEMLRGLVVKGKEPEHARKDSDKMDVDQMENSGERPHTNGAPKGQPDEAEVKRRREVLLLIQQLCVMGKNVQLPARMQLFRTLSDRGIVFAVQWGLNQPESDPEGLQTICAAGEILTALLDHDLNGVRNHVLRQLGPDDKNAPRKMELDTVLSVMCRVLVRSKDLAVQSQVSESLRVMLDTPANDAMEQHVGTSSRSRFL
jgi:protein phosphatase 4 regulatory subunit 3